MFQIETSRSERDRHSLLYCWMYSIMYDILQVYRKWTVNFNRKSTKIEMSLVQFLYLIVVVVLGSASAGSKSKPHVHQGMIEPYDGKPLPIHLTVDQQLKLEKGEAVTYNERSGKSGRGVVIQDINASTVICMERIRDLERYTKVVPHVNKVEIYENKVFPNGTSKTGAEFRIGLMGLKFQYFLQLTHEPQYNTLTWTLDYKYNSDFDDSCGHWQVMPHPSKSGWTRLLYSTKIKLFSMIPEFIVNFLTSKALTESTSWVKRESEQQAKLQVSSVTTSTVLPVKKKSWFNMNGGFFAPNNEYSVPFPQQSIFDRKLKLPACIPYIRSRSFKR